MQWERIERAVSPLIAIALNFWSLMLVRGLWAGICCRLNWSGETSSLWGNEAHGPFGATLYFEALESDYFHWIELQVLLWLHFFNIVWFCSILVRLGEVSLGAGTGSKLILWCASLFESLIFSRKVCEKLLSLSCTLKLHLQQLQPSVVIVSAMKEHVANLVASGGSVYSPGCISVSLLYQLMLDIL